MSESTDNAAPEVEKTEPCKMNVKFLSLPFGDLLHEIRKNPQKMFVFEGTTSIRQYWTAFMLIVLPALFLWAFFTAIAVFTTVDWTTAFGNYANILIAGAVLVFLPVMVRRTREIGIPAITPVVLVGGCLLLPLFAATCGVYFLLAGVIALGCISAKKSTNAIITEKYMFPTWMLFAIVIAGLMISSARLTLCSLSWKLQFAMYVDEIKAESQMNSCIANLKAIQGAKEQALMAGKSFAEMSDLVGPDKYLRTMPKCPSGGTYTVGGANMNPTCNCVDPRYPHVLPTVSIK